MRLLCSTFLLFATSVLASGCGAELAPSNGLHDDKTNGTGSAPSGGAGSGTNTGTGTSSSTGPDTIIGQVIALTESTGDSTLQRFDLDLQAISTPLLRTCDGATSKIGSCCYFGPVQRPPTQQSGSGTGTPVTESSAGAVTLTDATTNAPIQSFEYASGGYTPPHANYDQLIWQPGDTLRVDAAGADIGAFTVSAPALAVPSVQGPTTIPRAGELAFAWQPDTNAETVVLSFNDGDTGETVVCSAPDSAGSLTLDASLFAAFPANARLGGMAQRWAYRYGQTPTGRVVFKSTAWRMFDASTN